MSFEGLFGVRAPAVQLAYVKSSEGGTASLVGLSGDPGATQSTPIATSDSIPPGSTVVVIHVDDDPHQRAGIALSGWSTPPL